MAAIEYVDTTLADGNNDGTTWANAWRTDPTALASALASVDVGGVIYVKCDSLFTYAENITLASANGTAVSPVSIISVLETTANEPPVSGEYKTMTAGGGKVDAKTGGAFDILLIGFDIWVGMEFVPGDDLIVLQSGKDVRLINCKCIIDDLLHLNSGAIGICYLDNVDIEQVTPGGIYFVGGGLCWRRGSYKFTGGSVATNWLDIGISRAGNIVIEDVDIQGLDAGDYLVKDINAAWNVLIKRCKIPAACNYMNAGPTAGAFQVKFHSVDDGNNIHTFKEYYLAGRIESDTSIYLDATYDGTSGYSAKMVADKGATKAWAQSLRFKLADIWVSATGKTLTVELMTTDAANATHLNNNEFWIEVEYPDSTIGAFGNILTTRPATILTTAAELTASAKGAGDWTGEGADVNYYKCVADFTGVADEAVGVYTVWACLAKEAVVYVCPKVVVA